MSSMESVNSLFERARIIYSQEFLGEYLSRSIRTVRRWEKGDVGIPNMIRLPLKELLNGRGLAEEICEDGAVYGSKLKFTFVDLFAGIGGTRLAFERAGGKCIFTSEWNKYACTLIEQIIMMTMKSRETLPR